MYDVYYLLPAGASYAGNKIILGFWRRLLGQNAIEIDDLDAVCETIALTVGLGEAAVDLDQGLRDLTDVGSAAARTVSKALAPVGAAGPVVKSAVLPVPRGGDRIARL
jgi:hypothetical protein